MLEDGYHIAIRHLFLIVSKEIFLFLSTLICFWKMSFPSLIPVRILVSHLPSKVKTHSRYLDSCIFQFVTLIVSVLQLMASLFWLSFFTLSKTSFIYQASVPYIVKITPAGKTLYLSSKHVDLFDHAVRRDLFRWIEPFSTSRNFSVDWNTALI